MRISLIALGIVMASLLFIAACDKSPESDAAKHPPPDNAPAKVLKEAEIPSLPAEPPPEEEEPGLAPKLEKLKAGFIEKADSAVVDDYERAIEELKASGILQKAKTLGDKAPDFTLPDARGGELTLSELLKNGPVVLVWYRGGWCPYCNLELAAFQGYLADFKLHGGQLVAISPDVPEHALSTAEKQALEFPVISDRDNRIAERYGLVYTVPKTILKHWEGKIDLAAAQGNARHRLPLAATYVIDTDGTIQYAFLDADYRLRSEPSEVLQVLYKLSKVRTRSKALAPKADGGDAP